MFEAIVVVCWVELGKSICDTKYLSEYNSSSSCWRSYNTEKENIKNKYRTTKKSTTVAYGGCFKK